MTIGGVPPQLINHGLLIRDWHYKAWYWDYGRQLKKWRCFPVFWPPDSRSARCGLHRQIENLAPYVASQNPFFSIFWRRGCAQRLNPLLPGRFLQGPKFKNGVCQKFCGSWNRHFSWTSGPVAPWFCTAPRWAGFRRWFRCFGSASSTNNQKLLRPSSKRGKHVKFTNNITIWCPPSLWCHKWKHPHVLCVGLASCIYPQNPKRQWPERLVYVNVFFPRAYMHSSVCILRQKELRIINLNQPSFFSHLAMATTRLSEARCNSKIKLHHEDCGPTRACCWNDRRLFVWWKPLMRTSVSWLCEFVSKSQDGVSVRQDIFQFSKKLFRVSIGVYA